VTNLPDNLLPTTTDHVQRAGIQIANAMLASVHDDDTDREQFDQVAPVLFILLRFFNLALRGSEVCRAHIRDLFRGEDSSL
jgi:hypothetical protein